MLGNDLAERLPSPDWPSIWAPRGVGPDLSSPFVPDVYVAEGEIVTQLEGWRRRRNPWALPPENQARPGVVLYLIASDLLRCRA